MKPTLLALAWAFVAVVAAYDAAFAWRYRQVFGEWELNPLARLIAGRCGVAAVLALKGVVVAFAVCVAAYCYRRRHWLAVPYTVTVGGVHALLSAHYLLG